MIHQNPFKAPSYPTKVSVRCPEVAPPKEGRRNRQVSSNTSLAFSELTGHDNWESEPSSTNSTESEYDTLIDEDREIKNYMSASDKEVKGKYVVSARVVDQPSSKDRTNSLEDLSGQNPADLFAERGGLGDVAYGRPGNVNVDVSNLTLAAMVGKANRRKHGVVVHPEAGAEEEAEAREAEGVQKKRLVFMQEKSPLAVLRYGGIVALLLRYIVAPIIMIFANAVFWLLGGGTGSNRKLNERLKNFTVEGIKAEEKAPRLFTRSSMYYSAATIKIPENKAKDVFNYLSHVENSQVWQKNVQECTIPSYSPCRFGLGCMYISYGRVAFLSNYKVKRYLRMTRFNEDDLTHEVSQASPLTHVLYRFKVEDLPNEDGCLLHFSATISLTSSMADFIFNLFMGRPWIQKVMDNLLNDFLGQFWHAFDVIREHEYVSSLRSSYFILLRKHLERANKDQLGPEDWHAFDVEWDLCKLKHKQPKGEAGRNCCGGGGCGCVKDLVAGEDSK